MTERIVVVAKAHAESDLLRACEMIMEKVHCFACLNVQAFLTLQVAGDPNVNEDMSNFNLTDQRSNMRLSGAGGELGLAPMGMSGVQVGSGTPYPGMSGEPVSCSLSHSPKVISSPVEHYRREWYQQQHAARQYGTAAAQ